MVSCADTAAVQELDIDQDMILRCEIERNKKPIAYLQTTSALDGSVKGGFLSDAVISINTNGYDGDLVLEWVEERNRYEGTRTLRHGSGYTIVAEHEDFQGVVLSAGTKLPRAIKPSAIQQTQAPIVEDGAEYIPMRIGFNEKLSHESRYHVYFTRTKGYYEGDNFIYTGEEELDISTVDNDNFVVQELEHRPGVLVDHSRMDVNEINLTLKALNSSPKEITKAVYIHVVAVTDDYYKFHTALSKQISASIDPNHTPAISYSNIKGGYGVFAGCTHQVDSIPVAR